MMGYDEGPITQNHTTIDTNSLLSKVFFRMFLGLLATAITAAFTYYSGAIDEFVLSGGYIFCIIAEIVVALLFSLGFRKFSPTTVTVLFYTYAILTGLTFSTIFIEFELKSIVLVFLGTAAIFGILSYIGKTTNKDLTNIGTVLTVSLLTTLIVSIINLFVGNTIVDIILDWVIIAIFMGYTVYDVKKINELQESGIIDDDHLYIYGAMQLYLDFINIFIRLLELFGDRKRD